MVVRCHGFLVTRLLVANTMLRESGADRRQTFRPGASIRGRTDRLYGPCACTVPAQIALSPFISAKDVARDESYTDERRTTPANPIPNEPYRLPDGREEETNNDTREAD